MKKILDLQQQIEVQRAHLQALYGLTYINLDLTNLSAQTKKASLNYTSWKEKPTIRPICGDSSEMPVTFEEFEDQKRQTKLDIERLEKVAIIWQKNIKGK